MKKCIIITTINSYDNTSISKFLKYDYDIIIIGDKKTNNSSYIDKQVIFIDINNNIYPQLNKILPINHYGRKNLGYMYAIEKGYDIIFDTDDDNYPLENFNDNIFLNNTKQTIIDGPKFPNIYSLFTNTHIWPRGFPLELINKKEKIIQNSSNKKKKEIGIYQGIVNGDPDVDAIFRLTNQNYNTNITFDKNKLFIINKNIYVSGNTQTTFWTCKELFHLLYIPVTVSFRFCDILRMYIAQKCMWEYDKLLCYNSPIVYQIRNDHNLITDFISEYPCYTNITFIVDNIFEHIKLNGDIKDLLIIYKELLKHNIVKDHEIIVLQEWLKYISKYMIIL